MNGSHVIVSVSQIFSCHTVRIFHNLLRCSSCNNPAAVLTTARSHINNTIRIAYHIKVVHQRLEVLKHLGLGYLTLGEETPSLSGGEAQRVKLASAMGKGQSDSGFVFDEPTIGLHPADVQTLVGVF